jgi:hypothetical protein
MYEQVGWYLDCLTAARIRVSAIWKRHPEFTASQVMKKLGPRYPVRLGWVSKIMKQCSRASASHSAQQWRTGRGLRPWR